MYLKTGERLPLSMEEWQRDEIIQSYKTETTELLLRSGTGSPDTSSGVFFGTPIAMSIGVTPAVVLNSTAVSVYKQYS